MESFQFFGNKYLNKISDGNATGAETFGLSIHQSLITLKASKMGRTSAQAAELTYIQTQLIAPIKRVKQNLVQPRNLGPNQELANSTQVLDLTP
jgi:hypothetical protein